VATLSSGVFLEAGLETSWRFGSPVIRSFLRDVRASRANGVSQLAASMAIGLTAVDVHLNTPVIRVTPTTSRQRLHVFGPAVIVATDASAAARLLRR
jgi:hypothetical protein